MADQVTSRLFVAKDFSKALKHKEDTHSIMRRWVHSSLGVVYEVIYVPREVGDRSNEKWFPTDEHYDWTKESGKPPVGPQYP